MLFRSIVVNNADGSLDFSKADAKISQYDLNAIEETRYVSDELNTWVRSGPGDHYRLVGTVNAGEEVTLLQTDANTNYAQVKDSSGRTAWIPLKQLSTEPSLRSRVPDLENQVKTLTDKLTNIDNTWNQRTAEMQQKVAQSEHVFYLNISTMV